MMGKKGENFFFKKGKKEEKKGKQFPGIRFFFSDKMKTRSEGGRTKEQRNKGRKEQRGTGRSKETRRKQK